MQSETDDLHYEGESSSPSLVTSHAERQGQNKEVQKELKGLRRMVTSLSHRLETLQIQDSCQKSNSLPTVIAALDPPMVQSTPKAKQTHNNSNESPLQACIREAASRDAGFQLFPIIEQRDMQGNLLRIHTPISFKLLKELNLRTKT